MRGEKYGRGKSERVVSPSGGSLLEMTCDKYPSTRSAGTYLIGGFPVQSLVGSNARSTPFLQLFGERTPPASPLVIAEGDTRRKAVPRKRYTLCVGHPLMMMANPLPYNQRICVVNRECYTT